MPPIPASQDKSQIEAAMDLPDLLHIEWKTRCTYLIHNLKKYFTGAALGTKYGLE